MRPHQARRLGEFKPGKKFRKPIGMLRLVIRRLSKLRHLVGLLLLFDCSVFSSNAQAAGDHFDFGGFDFECGVSAMVALWRSGRQAFSQA
jgi:hypothetical protein